MQVAKQEAQYAAKTASDLAGVPFSASLSETPCRPMEGEESRVMRWGRKRRVRRQRREEEDGEEAEDAEEEEAARGSNLGAIIAVEAGRNERGVVLGAGGMVACGAWCFLSPVDSLRLLACLFLCVN